MTNHIPSIIKSIDYIEAHLKDNLNIGDVAKYIGFSKYHFSRVFKEATGYSPYDYYRGRKVTQAILYMQENQCKIIDAAFEYGFNSPEVFTRSCLSSFGMSPSQIRKSVDSKGFTGILPISSYQLLAYGQYRELDVPREELPSLIIKGYVYQSPHFHQSLDTNMEILNTFLDTSNTLYHLHWASDEENIYNHLIGTSIDSIENDFQFDNYVYKKIPTGDYFMFPTLTENHSFSYMEEFIYDYFLQKENCVSQKTFSLEVFQCSGSAIERGMLFVPYHQEFQKRQI